MGDRERFRVPKLGRKKREAVMIRYKMKPECTGIHAPMPFQDVKYNQRDRYKTMKRTIKTTIITMLIALTITLIPAGNTTAEAAAKKPGAVTKITKVKATQNTLKFKWNKAKNKTGYQVRVYAGKKSVKSVKTKKTTYTVKGLKPATKYTVKVRAYGKKSGKTIYGKEKKITYKTAKTPAKTPTPAPTPAPISVTEEDTIVLPGQSTSTGAALVAEYNAWITDLAKDEIGKIKDTNWYDYDATLGHFGIEYTYVAGCTNDKYQAFKTAQADLDTMNEILADWLKAIGLKNVSIHADNYGDHNTIVVCDLDDGGFMGIWLEATTKNKNGLCISGSITKDGRPDYALDW